MLRDLLMLSPLLIVIGCALTTLILAVYTRNGRQAFLAWLNAVGYLAAGLATWWLWRHSEVGFSHGFLNSMFVVNPYGLFWIALVVGCAALVAIMSADYLPEQSCDHGEYYALLSFAVSGMIVMAISRHLLALVLGLEIMSLSVYALAGFKRRSPFSVEAALKYFLLGAFSTAILLYGVALIYGSSGELDLEALGRYFVAHPPAADNLLPYAGLLLMLVAFGFKIAAVPFHMWTPDVYEGALPPVTAFMATAVKAASFAALIRVFFVGFDAAGFRTLPMPFHSALAILATVTMFVGNLCALSQNSIKRMLAYSSIAHVGYLLVGLLGVQRYAGPDLALTIPSSAVLYYLFAYSVANIGAFAVLSLLGRGGQENADMTQFAGLGRRHPVLAVAMTICLLSLAGVPPLAGFYAKYRVFAAALGVEDARWSWLVVVAVLNSAIAAYYYLRVTLYMYFREPEGEVVTPLRSMASYVVLVAATLLTVQAGIMPNRYDGAAKRAARTLLSRPAQSRLATTLAAATGVVAPKAEQQSAAVTLPKSP